MKPKRILPLPITWDLGPLVSIDIFHTRKRETRRPRHVEHNGHSVSRRHKSAKLAPCFRREFSPVLP
ncbi:MAG TPA: hypothetical protein VLT36_09305 [Candidatus Dormibacteraeota bacterium]|nr:hypothetical protein [Candidatus Dormibacteraeota bacterium]